MEDLPDPMRAARRPAARLRALAPVLAALGLLAGACATRSPGFYHVRELVAGAPLAGEVRTMDYVLYYRFEVDGGGGAAGELRFTGDVEPRPDLDVLDIRLHLLDGRNVVLASHWLYAPGAYSGIGRTSLRERFPVPPGAVFIAFSHYAHEDTRRILRDDDRRRRW